jgi:uncharacterized protein (TIGR02217 family)
MAHVEQRLLDEVDYGFRGGPTFNTRAHRMRNGARVAEALRERPLYRFRAPYTNLDLEDHKLVIDAFNACQGSAHTFRFKDWADFTAENQLLAVATGAVGQTAQLKKYYAFGSLVTERVIRKPVAGTLVLSAATPPTGVSVDTTTGIVTFTGTLGQEVYADFEFDVPVYFANDELIFDYSNFEALTADVELEEDFIP